MICVFVIWFQQLGWITLDVVKSCDPLPHATEIAKKILLNASLALLFTSLALVVVVDEAFDLFTRAWCVAELVESEARGIPQAVKVHSQGAVDCNYDNLSFLDVRNCRASRSEDKELILQRILNFDAFNDRLQWLIFGTEGIFKDCVDMRDRAAILGRAEWLTEL